MSDAPESTNRTPLSSSASNPSGTQALSVTVEKNGKQDEPAEADMPASDSSTFQHPLASNENETSATYVTAESVEQIDETASADENEFAMEQQQEPAGFVPSAADPFFEQPAETTQDTFENSAETFHDAAAESATAPFAGEASDQSENHHLPNGKTVKDLPDAVCKTMKENEADNERAFAMFEQMSQNFQVAMEDARNDAARISFKLMEFAQANFRNNFEFARDYAAARSVPDVF